MITLNDGSMHYISKPQHFRDMIQDKLGYEAAQYTDELIQQTEKARHLADSDFRSYEMQVEEQRNALLDIKELAQKLKTAKPKEREECIRMVLGIVSGHI